MGEPYVGEVRWFAFDLAPEGWTPCDGRLLPTQQYPELFAEIGATYGGDGVTDFAVPDLRDRVAVGAGKGPRLSDRALGETGGQETVRLTTAQMPVHTHRLQVSNDTATAREPGGQTFAAGSGVRMYQQAGRSPTRLSDGFAYVEGGGVAHNNMQPFMAVAFCIATRGLRP